MSTVTEAVAMFHPTVDAPCKGVIRFTQTQDSVKVVADIEGLKPDSKHALHIHVLGNCGNPDKGSAGGHYEPHAHKDDAAHLEEGHSGNLGTLTADSDGRSHFEVSLKNCSIGGVERPIIGRCVIIDAAAQTTDSHQHTAIGCAVIGIAKISAP
jgi:Cu-Zn family superoxide dismutase